MFRLNLRITDTCTLTTAQKKELTQRSDLKKLMLGRTEKLNCLWACGFNDSQGRRMFQEIKREGGEGGIERGKARE